MYQKILFIGNSITLHPPAPQIGWSHNFGMAASALEKDYVHLLIKRFTQAGRRELPQVLISNIADFERDYATYLIRSKLKKLAEFRADIVILSIAENVPKLDTKHQQDQFKVAVKDLLSFVKGSGQPAIYVQSGFWVDPVKDSILKDLSTELSASFVDISQLAEDPKNYAYSEQKFSNKDIAQHPGDRGMEAIAELIWDAVERKQVKFDLDY